MEMSLVLYILNDKFGVDMFIGIDGGPEGVLAASALDASNCFLEDCFDNDEDVKRAKQMGIKDLNRKYNLNEIVSELNIFCNRVTDGDLVKGINIDKNEYTSETLVITKALILLK